MDSVLDLAPTIAVRHARAVLRSSKWSWRRVLPADLNRARNVDVASLVSAFERLNAKVPGPDLGVYPAEFI